MSGSRPCLAKGSLPVLIAPEGEEDWSFPRFLVLQGRASSGLLHLRLLAIGDVVALGVVVVDNVETTRVSFCRWQCERDPG